MDMAWVPCICENYWCLIHGMHAHDCPCPPIEEWETDPYNPDPAHLDPPGDDSPRQSTPGPQPGRRLGSAGCSVG